jgi:hypothetical protein
MRMTDGCGARGKAQKENKQERTEKKTKSAYVETTETSAHVMQKIKNTRRRKPNM